MKCLKIVLQKNLILVLTCILFPCVTFAEYADIVGIIRFVNDKSQWEERDYRKHIHKSDKIYEYVELLGAIRSDDSQLIGELVHRFDYQYSDFRSTDPHLWFNGRDRNRFVGTYFIRTDSPTIGFVLDEIEKISKVVFYKLENLEGSTYRYVKEREDFNLDTMNNYARYFNSLLPYESTMALIEDRLQHTMSSKSKNSEASLERFKKLFINYKTITPTRSFIVNPSDFSDFTLNHPLYKARQSTIETNLELARQILKASKNLTSIDGESKVKLLTAIEELGRVRAVEAVEVLAPILLLQADKAISGLDKKYISLQKYPVGVAFAKIGIPSIWGLLEEVAKRSGNADEYRKVACDVMTTILIAKAIPGFVNETLDKHKDNELAQIRLAKLLPLLGEDATKIELLKPQFRNWQSADNLFEARAKFISLDKKNDVTLEKENGKQTTIEFSALRKEDQDYVKQLEPEKKTVDGAKVKKD
jgi:hypothetical protein